MAGSKNPLYVDIMALHPEVTGSCIFCVVKNSYTREKVKFIVDCGLFQEREHEKLNTTKLPFLPENIDFAIITHNHLDHIGRFPYLVKEGFYKPIFTTEQTKLFLKRAWVNTADILKNNSKITNIPPLYGEEEVRRTMGLVRGCPFNQSIQVAENIKVTFLQNGHVPGAAMVLVQISSYYTEDINLLFTGDYNSKNIFFDVEDIPEEIKNLPITIITESTYGDMKSSDVEETFRNNIIKAVKEKRNIIIPAFSFQRTQTLLYILKCLQESKQISGYFPICLDGNLSQDYTNIFIKHGEELGFKKEMLDFIPNNLKYIKKETRWDVIHSSTPKIIVTSSGMGSHGPAQMHIPEVLPQENGLIHFTGYMAEGTLGRKLQEAKEDSVVEVCGVIKKKRAKILFSNEFSSHAKSDEIINMLNQFNNKKLVLINHGETEIKDSFSKMLEEDINAKDIGILGTDYLFRVGPYGLIKTMSTKFCFQ